MPSEFASLLDLATSQGQTHSALLSQAKSAILKAYQKAYPKAPISSKVFLDPESGEVRILSEGEDVTPKEFLAKAQSIARHQLILALKTSGSPTPPPVPPRLTPIALPSHIKPALTHLFFWGYHLFYLMYVGLFLLAILLTGDFFQQIAQFKSSGFTALIAAITLLGVPLATMLHAARTKASSQFLSAWFFKVELPTVIIAFIMLVFSGYLIPPLQLLLLILLATPLFRHWQDTKLPQTSSKYLTYLGFFFSLGLTLVTLYAALLWLFYIPILTAYLADGILSGFFSNLTYFFSGYNLASLPFALLYELIGLAFRIALFSLTVFALILPLIFAAQTYRRFKVTLALLSSAWGQTKLAQTLGLGLLLWLILFIGSGIGLSSQDLTPKLAAYSKAQTFEEKQALAQELVPQKSTLQTQLSDNYRARDRYLFTTSSNFLSYGYQSKLHLPPVFADTIQQTFLTLAYPLVYHESLPTNDLNSAFTDLFGHSIWDRPYQSNPSTNVRLQYEQIRATTSDQDLLATVSVQHAYENKLSGEQEVIYEFILPPQAVVTDLKLGPNLEFQGQIAPRGAAQETYQQQLRVRRDPALLETIAPNTYRLRVYPIPSRTSPNLKVEFTYVTPLTPKGYPLPVYSRLSNLKKDVSSKYDTYLNDQYLSQIKDYLPASAEAITALCQPSTTPINVDLTLFQASLAPGSSQIGCPGVPSPAIGKNALLVDISSLAQTGNLLKDLSTHKDSLNSDQTDLYFFNTLLSQPQPLSSWLQDPITTPFGHRDLKAILPVLNDSRYDSIVLVLGKNITTPDWQILSPKKPLYLVTASTTASLDFAAQIQLLQSGSQTFTTIAQALSQSTTPSSLTTSTGPNLSLTWTDSNPQVLTQPALFIAEASNIAVATEPAEKIALNQYLHRFLRSNPTLSANQLAVIDALHQIAQSSGIVTPASSYIALVNQQQQQLLETLSQNTSRFDDVALREANPTFAPPESGRINTPFDALLGVDLNSFESPRSMAPMGSSGGISIGAPMYSMLDGGGGYSSIMNLFSGSLFILLNVILIIGAALVWLLTTLKKRATLRHPTPTK